VDTASAAREIRKQLAIHLTVHNANEEQMMQRKGPHIFVILNQTSLIESILIPEITRLPFVTFANIGYLLLPFIGWTYALSGAILVIPGLPLQTKHAVHRACAYLRDSTSSRRQLYMSIEGVRSPDGTLSPYRLGCARIAIATEATIFPFYIRGARRLLPRGDWRIKDGACDAYICKAISTKGMDPSQAPMLTNSLRALAEQMRRDHGE
jgi:1-acyl-sn-glycerol-3-phosphate acyltransferase